MAGADGVEEVGEEGLEVGVGCEEGRGGEGVGCVEVGGD